MIPAPIARLPWRLILPLTALVLFGSAVLNSAAGGKMQPWAATHLIRYGVFLVMALMIARLPRDLFRRAAYPVYGGVLVLLVLVELIGGIGGGSQRWLNLGFMTLQPSELMKPVIVLAFAPLDIADWPARAESDWTPDTIPLQYFLFPNTIVSVGSTSRSGLTINLHRIFPSSADHFVSKLSYCAIGGLGSAEHRAEVDRAYETARAALVNEDYSVAEESHAGLRALPTGTTLPVGRREIGVWNFHGNVARYLAGGE